MSTFTSSDTSPASPWARYQQDLKKEGFQHDEAQEKAVKHLQRLYDKLVSTPREQLKPHPVAPTKKGLKGLFGRKKEEDTPPAALVPTVRGLYFWGGVGRGKTYLVDNFHDSLPFDDKLRIHFNRFMQRVHKELEHHKGQKDPLKLVAGQFAREARVICFDEFYVKDIADAMILANLLEALFAEGVVLVATSNIEPQYLYENGLQRARFLPAIDLIVRHCEVVNVDSGVDYRHRTLEHVDTFVTPANEQAEQTLASIFADMAGKKGQLNQQVNVNGRSFPAHEISDGVVWFEFEALCDGPRSQNDYIELSRRFHMVLISHVPQFNEGMDDQARRFIGLVDEFYDRAVKLIMSMATPLSALYKGNDLAFEFERTLSRLDEMSSKEFLKLPHRP
ncbi:Cell division protein ZapE [Halomonadaceae bacterium LMG 33818]|uniref:cell division protein ZapE n=1 Tax=Cernens ardua TaxID=3402176 RepID=UPI003EDBD03D